MRKVSEEIRIEPTCSATEVACFEIGNIHVTVDTRGIIPSTQKTMNALIRLQMCRVSGAFCVCICFKKTFSFRISHIHDVYSDTYMLPLMPVQIDIRRYIWVKSSHMLRATKPHVNNQVADQLVQNTVDSMTICLQC